MVRAEDADAVIVATGARPGPLPFPAEGIEVLDQWQAMAHPPHDAEVVLFDTGRRYEGAALAETLAPHNHLRWVAPTPWVGFEVDPASAAPLRRRLAAHETELIPQTLVVGASAGAVTTVHVVTGRVATIAPVDTLVLAGNKRADRALADALAGDGPAVQVVGDAVAPRDVAAAILEGARAAHRLDDR